MATNYKYTALSPIQHQLEIELPWSAVEGQIKGTIKEFRESVEIKGFRKGKAPDNVIRAQIGEKHILERAAMKAAGDVFNEASKELEIKPISPPKIELGEIIKGEPVSFTATYFVQPPDAQTLVKEISRKQSGDIPMPEDMLPQGPPNIQHIGGGYPVSPDVLRGIPALSGALGDKFIPNPIPQIPDPSKLIPQHISENQEIPDPEELVKPVKRSGDVKEMKKHALEAHATKEDEVEEQGK